LQAQRIDRLGRVVIHGTHVLSSGHATGAPPVVRCVPRVTAAGFKATAAIEARLKRYGSARIEKRHADQLPPLTLLAITVTRGKQAD
jgi:hypothetical protein